jgi:hypothetical protein
MRTTSSMTGTSINTPTTVASAAPDSKPNRLIAAAESACQWLEECPEGTDQRERGKALRQALKCVQGEVKQITWTQPMRARFKLAYRQAVNTKAETFLFDGNEFVVGYAKYLIQYLDKLFTVEA